MFSEIRQDKLCKLQKRIVDNRYFLSIVVAIGVVLRFIIIAIGHNFDFDSYMIVGEIVKNGGNVYAETSRYNYGPLFFLVQGLLYSISSIFEGTSRNLCYRLLIVTFLTVADLGLMFYVKFRTNNLWAAVFFLNPVSIIITGFHNQFDNWAVLLAFIGVYYLMRGDQLEERHRWTKYDTLGISFLSLSLIMKHILFAFPIWLLFSKKIEWKKKIVYCFLPPILFLLSFLPFIKLGWKGILTNVFLYKSFNNFPLLGVGIIKYFVPSFTGLRFGIVLFGIFMIILGWLVKEEEVDKLILLYFVSLVCFSSAITNQYIAIPMSAVIILMKEKSFVYSIMGGIYLVMVSNGLRLYSFILEFGSENLAQNKVIRGLSAEAFMFPILVWILLAYLICLKKQSKKRCL